MYVVRGEQEGVLRIFVLILKTDVSELTLYRNCLRTTRIFEIFQGSEKWLLLQIGVFLRVCVWEWGAGEGVKDFRVDTED